MLWKPLCLPLQAKFPNSIKNFPLLRRQITNSSSQGGDRLKFEWSAYNEERQGFCDCNLVSSTPGCCWGERGPHKCILPSCGSPQHMTDICMSRQGTQLNTSCPSEASIFSRCPIILSYSICFNARFDKSSTCVDYLSWTSSHSINICGLAARSFCGHLAYLHMSTTLEIRLKALKQVQRWRLW